MENVDDSAQVIILASFLVAIGIVVLAVFLNSLIFAEDLSTRDDGLDERGISETAANAKATAYRMANSVGRNGSVLNPPAGNITEKDLYIPDQSGPGGTPTVFPRTSFAFGMNEYGGVLEEISTTRQRIVEIPATSTDAEDAWFIGQRGEAEFENESGNDNFPIFEDLEDSATTEYHADSMVKLEIYIDMNEVDGDDFVIVATDSLTPPDAAVNIGVVEWSMNVSLSDDSIYTNNSVPNTEEIPLSGADNVTVEIFPQRPEGYITLENGPRQNEPKLKASDLNDFNSMSIIEGDDAYGTYSMVLGESPSGTAEYAKPYQIKGPCKNDVSTTVDRPCVALDPNGDNRELYAVGAVRNGKFDMRYTDGDISYTEEFSGISAEPENLQLEVVE